MESVFAAAGICVLYGERVSTLVGAISAGFLAGLLRSLATSRQWFCNNSATTPLQFSNKPATTLQQLCNNTAIKQQAFSKDLNRQLPCIHNVSALLLPDPWQLKMQPQGKNLSEALTALWNGAWNEPHICDVREVSGRGK
jgi:hypothetical protein